jgi:hypothetical protein
MILIYKTLCIVTSFLMQCNKPYILRKQIVSIKQNKYDTFQFLRFSIIVTVNVIVDKRLKAPHDRDFNLA